MNEPDERSFFGSLNTIKTLVTSTCADKWEVAIETALPAAGKALYILIIPSPSEILENYLQPRGSRGRGKGGPHPHGRRQNTRFGRLRWWQKIGFPDIDAIIAQHLPGRDLFEGRSAGRAEQWLWKGIDILDRGLWYWMLLDMAEDFTVNWASGIMESRFCTSPFNALLSCQGQGTPTHTGNVWWNQASEVSVTTNFGWEVRNFGELRRQNPLIKVSGQFACSIGGTIRKTTDPTKASFVVQAGFFRGTALVQLARGPLIEVARGAPFEGGLQVNVTSFDRVIVQCVNPPGTSSGIIDGASWLVSFFGDPDT